MRKLAVVLSTVLLVALGACGNDTAGRNTVATPPDDYGTDATPAASGEAAAINDHGTKTFTEQAFDVEVEMDNEGADDFYFEPTFIKSPGGATATVKLHNEGTIQHTFTIDDLDVDEELAPDEEKTITVDIGDRDALRVLLPVPRGHRGCAARSSRTRRGSATEVSAPDVARRRALRRPAAAGTANHRRSRTVASDSTPATAASSGHPIPGRGAMGTAAPSAIARTSRDAGSSHGRRLDDDANVAGRRFVLAAASVSGSVDAAGGAVATTVTAASVGTGSDGPLRVRRPSTCTGSVRSSPRTRCLRACPPGSGRSRLRRRRRTAGRRRVVLGDERRPPALAVVVHADRTDVAFACPSCSARARRPGATGRRGAVLPRPRACRPCMSRSRTTRRRRSRRPGRR